MSVAMNILRQLGGQGRLAAMLGAYDFLDLGDGLRFKIKAKAKKKINVIDIKLDRSDTYNLKFIYWNRRKLDALEVDSVDLVYAERLRDVIEDKTGLRLSL